MFLVGLLVVFPPVPDLRTQEVQSASYFNSSADPAEHLRELVAFLLTFVGVARGSGVVAGHILVGYVD